MRLNITYIVTGDWVGWVANVIKRDDMSMVFATTRTTNIKNSTSKLRAGDGDDLVGHCCTIDVVVLGFWIQSELLLRIGADVEEMQTERVVDSVDHT